MPYQNLKLLRESLSMTQKDFAASLGIGQTTYNGYETGARDPKSDFWIAVAQKYGVTIDYLMGFSNDPKKTSETKKAPSDLSEEAHKIAESYERLTDHGKGAVRAILGYEETALVHCSQQEQAAGEALPFPKSRRSGPMVQINVYDQPSAAGMGNYLDKPDFHVEQYPISVIPPKTDFGVIISGDSMEPKVHDGGTVFVRSTPSVEPGKIGIFILNGQAYCKKLAVDQDNRQIRLVSINPAYPDILVGEFDSFRTLGQVLGQWTTGYIQDFFGW